MKQSLIQENGTRPEQLSLWAGSRSCANHSQQQEKEKERTITVTSGLKQLNSLDRFARIGAFSKTFAALLIGTGDWYSTKCRLIWKLKATKCYRFYFQLAPSTLPTEGIGFGLLHTPRAFHAAMEYEMTNTNHKRYRINDLMNLSLLPTPAARDYRSGFKQDSEVFQTRQQYSRGVNLHEHIQREVGQNFQLNPRFVAEMMSFPVDWTELPFLNGETKA